MIHMKRCKFLTNDATNGRGEIIFKLQMFLPAGFLGGSSDAPRSSRCKETESSMREKEFCELAEEEVMGTIGGWMVL
jgi:hypothetical protein